jgi:hypothetical protein
MIFTSLKNLKKRRVVFRQFPKNFLGAQEWGTFEIFQKYPQTTRDTLKNKSGINFGHPNCVQA